MLLNEELVEAMKEGLTGWEAVLSVLDTVSEGGGDMTGRALDFGTDVSTWGALAGFGLSLTRSGSL